jgi:hypothetical protein
MTERPLLHAALGMTALYACAFGLAVWVAFTHG